MPDLTDTFAARLDSLTAGDGVWTPPVPRDAATVCLLRDTADGPEVFVLRRVTTMAFAAGMHVYPGGAVEPSDADVPTALRVPDAVLDERTWSDRGRAVLVAAVRETFEECGVLLAVDAAGNHATVDDGLEAERRLLLGGERTFAAILQDRGLRVDDAAIVPFALWLTPEIEDRRYDTRFFVAVQSDGQGARHVGGEADRSAWWRPADALEAHAAGRMPMWPPTLAVMRFLAPHPTASAALEAARRTTVVPRMPETYRRPDGTIDVRLLHARTKEPLGLAADDELGTDA